MFAGELEVTADEDEHAAGGARGLVIDGGDAVLELLEREDGEPDGDEHAAGAGGDIGLAIEGGDAVLALLEREAGELSDYVWGALDLLTLESEHGLVLV